MLLSCKMKGLRLSEYIPPSYEVNFLTMCYLCCNEMFDKTYLKNHGFVLVECSREDSIIVGKSCQQEFGVPDYVYLLSGNKKKVSKLSSVCPIYSVYDGRLWACHAYTKLCLPTSVNWPLMAGNGKVIPTVKMGLPMSTS